MKTTFPLGLAALALLSASPSMAQKARYTITDLGTLGGATSIANAINSRGEIAGQAQDKAGRMRAVRWVGGKITDLGEGASESNAVDINDKGTIVGYTGGFYGTTSRAALWNSKNKLLRFELPPAWSKGGSALRAINNRGDFVGYGMDMAPGEAEGGAQAFRYTPGAVLEFGALRSAQGTNAIPNGINEAGEVVLTVSSGGAEGTQGTQAGWKVLDPLPEPVEGNLQLWDINDRGEVAACLNESRALLLKTKGADTKPVVLGAGLPTRINNRGVMVGVGRGGATLFKNGQSIDFNTLVAKGSGWTLLSAHGINDAGQIVGFGKFKGSQMRAFLLSPAKE